MIYIGSTPLMSTMMPDVLTPLLRRVRRRMAVAALMDQLLPAIWAMGLIIAGAGSLGWMKMGVVAAAIVLAAVTIWTLLRRRPALLDAAVELDRHYQLHELISTAWLSRANADAWSDMVYRSASAKAVSLAPPPMMTRFGMRVYVATVLAAAVAGLGALLLKQTVQDEKPLYVLTDPASSDLRQSPDPAAAQSLAGANAQRRAESATSEMPQSGDGAGDDRPRTGNDAARGAGRADSDAKSTEEEIPSREAPATPRRPIAGSEADRLGSGAASETAGSGSASGTGRVTSASAVRDSTSPDLSTWPQQRDAAARDLAAGRVPERYHDMVRAYFDQ
ncbi:MAG TPA: hypothetical protein VGB55_05705 [Tepidisphaeraceae bacterium]|jgi:hypothetical protein